MKRAFLKRIYLVFKFDSMRCHEIETFGQISLTVDQSL